MVHSHSCVNHQLSCLSPEQTQISETLMKEIKSLDVLEQEKSRRLKTQVIAIKQISIQRC